MIVHNTELPGVQIIQPEVFLDSRGQFNQLFQSEEYSFIEDNFGAFVQDNVSVSHKKVFRGFHQQAIHKQGKLVSCLSGKILDFAIDLDPQSPNFLKNVQVELTGKSMTQLWIPPNYFHGFCSLDNNSVVHYKCTDFYYPGEEIGVNCLEEKLQIKWPYNDLIISNKDQKLPLLDKFLAK